MIVQLGTTCLQHCYALNLCVKSRVPTAKVAKTFVADCATQILCGRESMSRVHTRSAVFVAHFDKATKGCE